MRYVPVKKSQTYSFSIYVFFFFLGVLICLPSSKIDGWTLSQRETRSLWKRCQREKLKRCHTVLVSELEWKLSPGIFMIACSSLSSKACSSVQRKKLFLCPVPAGNWLTLWSIHAAHWLVFLGVETHWDVTGFNARLFLKSFLHRTCGNLLGSLVRLAQGQTSHSIWCSNWSFCNMKQATKSSLWQNQPKIPWIWQILFRDSKACSENLCWTAGFEQSSTTPFYQSYPQLSYGSI